MDVPPKSPRWRPEKTVEGWARADPGRRPRAWPSSRARPWPCATVHGCGGGSRGASHPSIPCFLRRTGGQLNRRRSSASPRAGFGGGGVPYGRSIRRPGAPPHSRTYAGEGRGRAEERPPPALSSGALRAGGVLEVVGVEDGEGRGWGIIKRSVDDMWA
jgi:hypothetical protein